MGDQPTGIDELTWIAGRSLEAFTSRGDTATIDIACERVGPPADVGTRQGTSFRVTLRNVPVRAENVDAGAGARELVTIQQQAPSLWAALREARSELDQHGWLLPIAASRIDRWSVYGERRPDASTVHPFGDLSHADGMLQDAPPQTVATVAAQQQAYEQWLATQHRTPGPAQGTTAGASS